MTTMLRTVLDEILFHCGRCEIVKLFQNHKISISPENKEATHKVRSYPKKPLQQKPLTDKHPLPLAAQRVYFKNIWTMN